MSRVDVDRLREIAEVEFSDVVEEAIVPFANELRIILRDGSFLDVWFSLKLPDRYSYHWERRGIDGKIFRHDNAPHKNWQFVATFPNTFMTAAKMLFRKAGLAILLTRHCGSFSFSYALRRLFRQIQSSWVPSTNLSGASMTLSFEQGGGKEICR